MVTKDEKDYSDYVQHNIGLFHGQQFITGFLLAVFTIVLAQLPDPSALQAQIALLFFSVLLNLYEFLTLDSAVLTLYYCRKVPPFSKHLRAWSSLTFVANALVTVGVTPVLFVLWNLPTLAIASGISSLFFVIASFIFVIRPYRKWRKTAS